MKILFITDLIPINNENITKALFNFVQEWQKQGHSVDIIRPNIILNTLIRGRKIIKEKVYKEDNITIYNLNFITPFWFNINKKLPKEFSIKNYDVMISHMPCGALFSNRLLKKDKIKYVCSVHASDIHVLKSIKYLFYFRNQLKKAYGNADKISARSPVLQKEIERILPSVHEKTFVAYSGINQEITPKQINTETPQITTTASLIKRKNIDLVIQALSLIKKDFRYTIIGEGKERKHIEKLIKFYNLHSKINLTGRLDNKQVIKLLKKSDIFILVSDKETYGISYLEAMANGNIVIAKKNDGIDGILQNEQNSFLTEANTVDIRNTIEKILTLKENELLKIQNNSIQTIKALTSENAAKNYIQNIS